MVEGNSIEYILEHYFTSRIDIKNVGGVDNSLIVLESSDDESPKWFKHDDGNGCIIQSCKCELDLKIKCINDGKLNIKLRGIDVVDISGNNLPIFINFTNFSINNELLFNDNILVSYDNFYQYDEKVVKNDEIVSIHVEWSQLKLNFCNDSFNFFVESNLNNNSNNVQIPKKIENINVPKVSIIIPVFNPGELLYKCINSVVNQSLKDIEIICVDDGSTDNSLEILNNYAKNDNRFKILHQENKGAGFARNMGIDISKGEFIIFIDSDDWIEEDMCEKLYYHAKKLDSDLVMFNSSWHTPDGIEPFCYFETDEFKENFKEFTFDYHLIKNKLMIASYGVIWSRFYKSSFIKNNKIKFPKHKIYNDVEFCFKTVLLAKNIAYYPKTFYHYIKLGQPSLQTSFREGKDELVWFNVLRGLYRILEDYNFIDEFRLDFINYCIFYSYGKLKDIDESLQSSFLNEWRSFFKILNPSSKELDSLKFNNLTWYSSITADYLPLYYGIMEGNFIMVKTKLLELKLIDLKENLQKTPMESKEEYYQFLRDIVINSNWDLKILKKLPVEIYDFYMSVMSFETYNNFSLFSDDRLSKTLEFKDVLWYDVNNSKNVDDYFLLNDSCGSLKCIDDFKQLEVFIQNPVVVRCFSSKFEDDLEVVMEVKVTDYANIGLSNCDDVLKFSYIRISNKDWLYYRFIRLKGFIYAYYSVDGINWERIELNENKLDDGCFQFQFNCGYSNSLDKKVLIKNIMIFKI